MKVYFGIGIICLFCLFPNVGYSAKMTKEVVVADFNSGKDISNLGQAFGVWNKDPFDKTQGCYMGFIDEGDNGKYLKVKYDVDSPRAAYNGIWFLLGDFDASRLGKLVFKVKGDVAAFKIELKSEDEIGYYYVSSVEDRWSKIVIPLSRFKNITDFTKLKELVFVFDDMNSVQNVGSFCLDDIAFEESIIKKIIYREKVAASVNLSGVDLAGVNLERSVLNKINFYRANLSKANLGRTKLIGADLIGAVLNWANLSGANLTESNLYRATLTRATLDQAILKEADLRFALLNGASLKDADLTEADLKGANFKNANMSGVILTDANVEDANFFGVQGLTADQRKYLKEGRAKGI